MEKAPITEADDPVVAKMFRYPSGLRRGGVSAGHEVLATYHMATGERPFAICRDGILVEPETAARFIRFVDIDDTGYYAAEKLNQSKEQSRRGDMLPETLSLRLCDGEILELPLDRRDDGMSERLAIGEIVERRVRLPRAEAARSELG